MERLDFIEAQAQRLAAFRLETMEMLNKRAHTLITLQLGGGGALAAFAARLETTTPPWVVLGVVVAAVLLLLAAGVGTWLCLFTAPIVPPGNEPKNLFESDLELDALRGAELAAVQIRQASWAARNWKVGVSLNWLYMATAAIPLFAIGVAALAR